MIYIRSEDEIDAIRAACRLTAQAMERAREWIRPGVMTREMAEDVRVFIESRGGKAAFLGYNGFPGAICVSLNEQVVHGIPGDRVLESGDLVKLDVGAFLGGFYGDMARTFPVDDVSDGARALVEATVESFWRGIARAVPGNHTGDIGYAIQSFIESRGYNVVRALVGHGIGRNPHEEPQVPNFGRPGKGYALKERMVLAVEPMVNRGTYEIDTLDDDWTVVTADGSLSAHYENTIVVRDSYPEILTLMSGEESWQKKTP
ncbi:type I methionyl aminopeptidase [Candidatus Latescibacterota bacterium]